MFDCLSICGGVPLNGSVSVAGAKNSALPLIISTILTSEECVLDNVPDLDDIDVILRLLSSLGATVKVLGNKVTIQTKELRSLHAPYSLVKKIRASFWLLGPLLVRGGEAHVSLPGGDVIGSRPVDLHLKGLAQMGADIRLHHGVVIARAPGGLTGKHIKLDFPSVGATHHLLMTAARVSGETQISGAACEPEVVEVAKMLRAMGADVEGEGSHVIRINGREDLGGANVSVGGDRIEAATYLIAGAVTKGNVKVKGVSFSELSSLLDLLSRAGCVVQHDKNGIAVSSSTYLSAVSFETGPFPSVATDAQPLLMAALTRANGVSKITETVFDNRFGHIAEYRRFGASIDLHERVATVTGVPALSGAPVEATDIRAAAGLVLMGLAADGETRIFETHHLHRGYENLVEKLASLGAKVRWMIGYDDKETIIGC
jgi:UDP-N-acetylglucosamine 1-carboxyvinyltransferase